MVKVNIYYQEHRERTKIDVIREQKYSVILRILWFTCHNPEIDWRIGELKIIRCSEEYRKQQRPKQGKPEQQKQEEEEKKKEERKKQEENKQKEEEEKKKKQKKKEESKRISTRIILSMDICLCNYKDRK